MPIQIDHTRTRELAPRFDEALELVRNEFESLDSHRQYRNAFARLLKPDPLDRVLMMGTDQRDLFVPHLQRTIETSLSKGGHIFDVGAGDGQTFALVAGSVPRGTRISIEEPNAEYLAAYTAFLRSQPHLEPGAAVEASFDDIDEASSRSAIALPDDGSVDLVLALQMLFFLSDLPAGLARMVRFLRPGGTLFNVVADETDGYTGLTLNAFIEAGGDTGHNERHQSAIAERRRLLGSPELGGGAIIDVLREAGVPARLEAELQPSRLYGHSLADLIALSNISVLSEVDGTRKFEIAMKLLRDHPDAVDLRIEDDGPRRGMWSVTQPQWVSRLCRVG